MVLLARILALVAAAATVSVLSGCAEEEYDAREAAYPPSVGYNHTPRELMGSAAAASDVPPAPPRYVAESQGGAAPGSPIPPGAVTVDDSGGAAEPSYGPEDQYADTDPSALTDFRSTLDPYGSWTEDPTYGTVWVPSSGVVGNDFTPYVSAGHWTYDDDYTWVSDYDWGWAPFHYGRWVYSTPYGWGWIPGRTYAGAWVSWRYGYGDWGYVGWGPMAPRWGWRGGAPFGLGFTSRVPYGFVGTGNLFARGGLRECMVRGSQVGEVAQHTRPWTAATPTVNGRTTATPKVNGPPPSALGIPASGIARGETANRGVLQARAFAHAGTATSMGGHAPQPVASRGMASGRSASFAGGGEPSHFGGRMLGSGFRGSALNMRPSGGSSMGGRPYYGGSSSMGSRGMGSPGGGSYGGYGGRSFGGGYGGYGHPGGAPPGGGSGHHFSSEGGGGGGYHGGGGGGGYHGGGGFRGGGGGGHGGGGRR